MQFKAFALAATFAAGSQALVLANLGINGNGLQLDLNSLLNNLRGGNTDPTNLLSGLLTLTKANSIDPAVVTGQLTQLSSLLGGTNLAAASTSSTPLIKSSNVIGNLTQAQGLILSLFTNIGKLPIDANGLVLPSNQKGLCAIVDTLLQVEASLLKTLVGKDTGVLTKIPLLGLVASAAIDVQLLLQTLILQILSLTPLCNVQSTESLNGLSGVFQNLLGTLSSVGSSLGPNLATTISTLLKTLSGSSPLITPSTPLIGSVGKLNTGGS